MYTTDRATVSSSIYNEIRGRFSRQNRTKAEGMRCCRVVSISTHYYTSRTLPENRRLLVRISIHGGGFGQMCASCNHPMILEKNRYMSGQKGCFFMRDRAFQGKQSVQHIYPFTECGWSAGIVRKSALACVANWRLFHRTGSKRRRSKRVGPPLDRHPLGARRALRDSADRAS